MASLTGCIKKAGKALSADDKAAILKAAQEHRADGMKATEAGRKAIADLLEAVRAELAEVEAAQVEAPAEDAADQNVLDQSAFHGTPHKVDKFSLHKIGSGEGAQAFGWGLYFAGKREIAEHYRKTLSDTTAEIGAVIVSGQKIDAFSPEGHAARLLYYNDQKQMRALAKEMLKDAAKAEPYAVDIAQKQGLSAADYYGRLNAFIATHTKRNIQVIKGNLYEVELPDDDQLLDYDKSIGTQPAFVKEKLKASGILRDWKESRSDYSLPQAVRPDRGGALYALLSEKFGGDQAASQYLQSIGIHGMRYKAGQMAGVKGGGHNYVIWDEGAIGEPTSLYQGGDAPRAQIAFGQDVSAAASVISLLDGADLSSFIHEAGHFFLEVQADIAIKIQQQMAEGASVTDLERGIVEDFNAALRWMGVTGLEDASGKDGGALEQSAVDDRVWRSALKDAADVAGMNAAPAAGWKQLFKGLTQKGVKPDEIEWSGLSEWLDLQTGKVTKQQIADYLDANGVKVTETVLGVNAGTNADATRKQYIAAMIEQGAAPDEAADLWGHMARFSDDERSGFDEDKKDRGFALVVAAGLSGNEIHDAFYDDKQGVNDPKYANYTLPGGTNYREVLLTLPTDESKYPKRRRAQLWENGELTAQGPVESAERWRTQFPRAEVRIVDLPDKQAAERAGNLYRSGHWDQPNVLAHIRLNDRTDASGARVLFVEEVQSDWGQEGKKRGFNRKATPQEVAREVYGQDFAAMDPAMQDGVMAEVEARNEGMGGAAGNGGGLVPTAPFVGKTDAWVALALKRVIKMAVDGGYDKVAFVTGEQSADRYDLSKQVKRISWIDDRIRGGRIVTIKPEGGKDIDLRVADDGTVGGINFAGGAGGDFGGKNLSDVIGKDLADKVLATKSGTLSGDGLKVGGEGMKAFYDKIVPTVAKDVLRKLGGGAMESVHTKAGLYQDGKFVMEASDSFAAHQWVKNEPGREVRGIGAGQPGFTITDKMRDRAAGGVPLFQGGEQQDQPDAPRMGRTPLDTWAMMSMAEKTYYHERFARGFEAYAFDGKAPSIALQGVFNRFRAWLKDVYRWLLKAHGDRLDAGLDAKLSPDIRGVMDRMIATDEAIEEAEAARGFLPLFKSAEDAAKFGWSVEKWQKYQALGKDATDAAQAQLSERALKDMKWLGRARDKALKARQREVEDQRREVRAEIRMEVYSEPVYRAWQFLTGRPDVTEKGPALLAYEAARDEYRAAREKAEADAQATVKAKLFDDNPGVTGLARGALVSKNKRQMDIDVQQAMLTWDQAHAAPERPKIADERVATGDGKAKASRSVDVSKDSLLVAIAKLGGISRDSAKRDAGVSEDDLKVASGVFGAPVFRKTGGRNADDMREALTELGYLHERDEFGRTDLRGLSDAISNELGGSPEYSFSKDYGPDASGDKIGEEQFFGKLNTDDLRLRYGNSDTAVWRKLSALRMTSDTGLDADVVAEFFEFDSGDALVRALAEATPPREAIEARTDERMLQMFGDITSPEALARAADEAVMNKVRAKFLASEWKALEDAITKKEKRGKRSVDLMAIAAKEYAAQIVARLKVRDIKPAKYAAAAARNGKLSAKAFTSAKLEEAAMHKRNQTVNAYAADAAYEALHEVEKARAYLRKFDKPIKTIERGYQDQIEQLLERFDFKAASLKQIDKRKSLADWVAEQQAMGNEPSLPEDVLNEAVRKSYKDMTVEELRGLVESVKQIEHLGRLKNKLMLARDKRTFDAVADEMAATIVQFGGKARPVELEGARGVKPWFEGVAAQHRKLSSLFRQMDGGSDNGPLFEHIGRAMNERGTMEDVMTEKATVRLQELYAPLLKMTGGITGYRSKVFIKEINASLTRGGRLAVALNWGNEQNRQRIRDGDKWTDAQVNAILKTLTTQELEFVNGVWEYLDTFWPEVSAKEERLLGVAPEKVAAEPFVLKSADGTEVPMRGGYYPLKYDSDRSDRAEQQEAAQVAKEMMQGAYSRATTRRGHTKERLQEVKRPVRKDLNVITQHITQVVHDLAWHEWLIDTNRLLSDDRVVSAVRDHYGPKTLKTMRDAIMGIAAADVTAQTDIDKALLLLRSNVTRATMGASITTAFLQPFGLTQSMVRIGPKHVLRGLARWGGDAARMESSMTWINEKSDFMRLRAKTFNRELREISGRIGGKSKALTVLDAGLFMLMQKMQLVSDVPTWLGQYEKTMAEGPTEDTDEARDALEAKAVAMADRAVIESQGSGAMKDLAEVQRKHPMLTQFYSYFSVTVNLTAERTAATDFRNPRAVAGWLGDMALLNVIPALLPAMILDALKGGDDDDEEWQYAKKIAQWQAGYLMGLVVGVRELSGAVSGFDYAGPPVGRIVGDIGKAGKQTAQGEIDEPAVLAYARLIGTAFGIPITQVMRSYKGWKAWDEGQEGAGPQSVLFGPPAK